MYSLARHVRVANYALVHDCGCSYLDEFLTCAHSSVLSECGDVAAEWTHEFNRRRFIEVIELLRCDVTSFILPGQLLCHLISNAANRSLLHIERHAGDCGALA